MDDRGIDKATILAITRTHLANERTFAAWVRTGLSIAAAGIAVSRVASRPEGPIRWLAATFILIGSIMIVFGGVRFDRVARDLDRVGANQVHLKRHVVYALVGLLAALVVGTFLVLV